MGRLNANVAAPAPVILVHAPAGSGKSQLAGTLSQHYIERPAAARNSLISLSDLLFVEFDRDGLLTLEAKGLDLNYYDFSSQPESAPALISAILSRLKEIPAKMKELNAEWLIVDTFSSIEMYLDTYYLAQDAQKQHPNTQRAYATSQAVFRQLVSNFKALNCPQLWLCHSRSAYISELDPMAEQKEAQQKALRPGNYDVGLGLTPANVRYIVNLPSFIFGLEVGDGGKRSLVTGEGCGYYVKNRLGDLLQPREEPNLRKLVDKIASIKDALSNKQ